MCWINGSNAITSVDSLIATREQGFCWLNKNFPCPYPRDLLCSPGGCVELISYENKRKGNNK